VYIREPNQTEVNL